MKFFDALKVYNQSHPGTTSKMAKKGTALYDAVMKIAGEAKIERDKIPKTKRQISQLARRQREKQKERETLAELTKKYPLLPPPTPKKRVFKVAPSPAPKVESFEQAFAARNAAPKKRVFKVASAAAEARLAAEAAAKDAPAAPKKRVFKVVKDAPAEAASAAPKQRVFKVVKKPEQVEEEVTEKPKMSTTVLAANIRAYKAKNIENEG